MSQADSATPVAFAVPVSSDTELLPHEQIARHFLLQLEEFALAPEQTISLMQEFVKTNPLAANTALCMVFDVACYPVNHLGDVPDIPAEEQGMFFASVPVNSFLASRINEVALGKTRQDAESNAVMSLNLLTLFINDQQDKLLRLTSAGPTEV